MRYMLMVATVALLAACDDPNGAQNALSNMGFTNIRTTGYSFFGCGDDDAFHTAFRATNPQGKTVTGVVCSGVFKGATVRF